jgi:hypothetical protein
MKLFHPAVFEVTPNMLDIENGYDKDAILGLLTRCAVCGNIKAAELFVQFLSDEYAMCLGCLEKIRETMLEAG